jgi:hypothetical protein
MKLNVEAWKAELDRVVAAIRELKSKRTESHRPRWVAGQDDHALAELKREATLLCCIRAHSRGRLHFGQHEDWDLAKQAEFIGEDWKNFEAPTPEVHAG